MQVTQDAITMRGTKMPYQQIDDVLLVTAPSVTSKTAGELISHLNNLKHPRHFDPQICHLVFLMEDAPEHLSNAGFRNLSAQTARELGIKMLRGMHKRISVSRTCKPVSEMQRTFYEQNKKSIKMLVASPNAAHKHVSLYLSSDPNKSMFLQFVLDNTPSNQKFDEKFLSDAWVKNPLHIYAVDDNTGNLVGIALLDLSRDAKHETAYISYFVARYSYGTLFMQNLRDWLRYAYHTHYLVLEPTEYSLSFYKKLGFHKLTAELRKKIPVVNMRVFIHPHYFVELKDAKKRHVQEDVVFVKSARRGDSVKNPIVIT